MRSSSRNIRRPLRALGMAGAVCLLLGSAAQAADPSHSFVLTAFSNGKGGRCLIDGNYAKAQKALNRQSSLVELDASTTSNNRCVALTVTRQLDQARRACNQAVGDAEQEKSALPAY